MTLKIGDILTETCTDVDHIPFGLLKGVGDPPTLQTDYDNTVLANQLPISNNKSSYINTFEGNNLRICEQDDFAKYGFPLTVKLRKKTDDDDDDDLPFICPWGFDGSIDVRFTFEFSTRLGIGPFTNHGQYDEQILTWTRNTTLSFNIPGPPFYRTDGGSGLLMKSGVDSGGIITADSVMFGIHQITTTGCESFSIINGAVIIQVFSFIDATVLPFQSTQVTMRIRRFA